MDYRYIWITVSLLTSAYCSYGSQVIATSFGKNATLPCQIANLDSDLQFLHWEKDGKIIYSRTSKGEHTSGKNLVIDATSLIIPDAMESDAGNYSCIVGRKSFAIEESDIMQLYVIDVSVSHCKDTGQEVDGCRCNINGSNITYLQCSAAGFPHPSVITWEEVQEDIVIYQSSSVDLTRFRENTTLTCKARDVNLKSVVANKTVCVYYAREATSSGGSRVEATTALVNDQARVAAIVLSIFLIPALLTLLILCFAAVYLRKTGKVFRLPYTLKRTSMSKATSVGDLPTSQPESTPVKDEFDDVNLSTNDYSLDSETPEMYSSVNVPEIVDMWKDSWKSAVVDEEQPSLVGLLLLDDLRSAPKETKEFIKAAIVALLEKRVEPYKNHQSHVDPTVTIHTSFMNETLQRSMKSEDLGDPDAAFVYMVLQHLDGILDERDRDECEILITMPDFHEVTDESQIPAYQGNRVIQSSLPMQANMTSSMTSSMVACNQLATALREELVNKPSERAAIRNNISQIILEFQETRHSGLTFSSYLNCSTAFLPGIDASSYAHEVVDEDVSRLVAFWTCKIVKLDNDISNRIKKYLFPLKPRNINKSSVSDPVVQTLQEEDEIPDTPSTAKLLEEKCRDSK